MKLQRCRAVLLLGFLATGLFVSRASAEPLVDFEILGSTLAPNSFNNNAGGGSFVSKGASFSNTFTDFGTFTAWTGFAISNMKDTTTPGFGNQYSAFPGSGDGGSDTYGIAFSVARITAPFGATVESFSVTNTTYAALSMKNGDAFAKKFGGPSGNDPDFFKMIITGWDIDENVIGTQEFFLGDFRGSSSEDYIVEEWTKVNVNLPEAPTAVTFAFDGSDKTEFGGIVFLNTPAYAAIDDVLFAATIPEPTTLALMFGLGLMTLVGHRRRTRRRA